MNKNSKIITVDIAIVVIYGNQVIISVTVFIVLALLVQELDPLCQVSALVLHQLRYLLPAVDCPLFVLNSNYTEYKSTICDCLL